MKKKISYCIFFILQNGFLFAQTNLVPNYSFEQYDTCPYNSGQIYYAVPWFQPNTVWGNTTNSSSTDYFNACALGMNVPYSPLGFQYAKTGNGYGGFIPYFIGGGNREYSEVELDSALKAGKKYCVEFYVSLANSAEYGVGSIGAYLSIDSILYSDVNASPLPYIPQINNPITNIITDTVNWVLISGSYIAGGGEKFITIGNFNNNANSNAQFVGNPATCGCAYYYVDDVSVYYCDTTPQPPPPLPDDSVIYVPNAFSPNGDGENDMFFVQGELNELHCSIFNRWGEQVAQIDLPKQGWDGRVNGLECNTGVYFYYLIAKDKNGKEIIKKGNITLLR